MRVGTPPSALKELKATLCRGSNISSSKGDSLLSGDEVDTWGYNRDNGSNAAENVVKELGITGDANSHDIQMTHKLATLGAAVDVEKRLSQESSLKVDGGVAVVSIGLSDVASVLGPKVREITGRRN